MKVHKSNWQHCSIEEVCSFFQKKFDLSKIRGKSKADKEQERMQYYFS